ncbi:MAG: hypothetical protein IJ982_14735 [Fibrobacter sp.]|nr:hypothetical protein [Fibrobacter sp.]
MKKTRSITTTVTVQPSDVEFVPKLGEVPNETVADRVRRMANDRKKRYLLNPENRRKHIRCIIECVRRQRERKKLQKTA